MPTLNLNSIELVSVVRPVASKGAPSSDDYNDTQKELLIDLAALSSAINESLLALVNALPDTALLPVEAPVGIQGRTIYTDTSDNNQLFFDALANKNLSIADSLRLLNGMLDTFRGQLEDMGIQVSALQTRLASDNRNDIALALQNLTNTINQVTSSATSLTNRVAILETAGLASKTKSQRVATTSIGPGATESFDINWTVAFLDNNYTLSPGVADASGYLQVTGFTLKLAGVGVTIRVHNTDPSASHTGSVHAIAIHD
jgi:hypothetical protein